MPGKKDYGPGGKWIHDRAHHIMKSQRGAKNKQMAYAIATQQAHKLGKSPKNHETIQGKQSALSKYDKPKEEYKKTAEVYSAAYRALRRIKEDLQ